MRSAPQEGQAPNDAVQPRVNYRVKIEKIENEPEAGREYTTRVLGIYNNEKYYGVNVEIQEQQRYTDTILHPGTPLPNWHLMSPSRPALPPESM